MAHEPYGIDISKKARDLGYIDGLYPELLTDWDPMYALRRPGDRIQLGDEGPAGTGWGKFEQCVGTVVKTTTPVRYFIPNPCDWVVQHATRIAGVLHRAKLALECREQVGEAQRAVSAAERALDLAKQQLTEAEMAAEALEAEMDAGIHGLVDDFNPTY